MRSIEDNISSLIQTQFPAFYQEDGSNLVEFVKAYYTFLEETGQTNFYIRNLIEYRDIDKTIDDFVVHFKEKYLKYFPYELAVDDTRFLVKHIMDFYRSKGSERSYEIFFRSVYNATPTIYYPKQDVFKLSDGKWFKPVYLEVIPGATNLTSLVQKQVIGSVSQATAFVEGIITNRVAGKYVNVVYLSNVEGTFQAGEVITLVSNPLIEGFPRVLGSLSSVDVITGGENFEIGDLLNITTGSGRKGVLRVTGISTETGIVSFELVDGGFGFTNTSSVLVSQKVMDVSGNGQSFTLFETVRQPLANIDFLSANGVLANGDVVVSYYSNGVQAGNGVILSTDFNTETGANGTILISTVSGNVGNGASGVFYKNGNTIQAVVNTYVNVTATGNVMASNATSIGVVNISGTFVSSNNNYIIGDYSGYQTSIEEIGLGTGATFQIGNLANPEDVRLDSTFLSDRNTGNVALMSVRLDASNANTGSGYGFIKYPGGDKDTILLKCFEIDDYVIGTIASLVSVDGGQDYTKIPFVRVYERKTAGYNKRDLILNLTGATTNFADGEIVEQTSVKPAVVLTVNSVSGNTTSIEVGEYVYQSNGTANVATGYIYSYSIANSAGSITLVDTTGTFNTSYQVATLTTAANAVVTTVDTDTINITGKGLVKAGSNTTLMYLRRLTFFDTFGAGNTIVGIDTGATATISAVTEDTSTLNMGNNSIISANVIVANGTITSVDVYDSGFGYIDDEVVTAVKVGDGSSAISVKTQAQTQGVGQGYYKEIGSEPSGLKKLHDGYYYQDFSYDVKVSIPFDKYKDILKQVIHVAGTKLFGTYVNQTDVDVTLTANNAQITELP